MSGGGGQRWRGLQELEGILPPYRCAYRVQGVVQTGHPQPSFPQQPGQHVAPEALLQLQGLVAAQRTVLGKRCGGLASLQGEAGMDTHSSTTIWVLDWIVLLLTHFLKT